MTVSGCRNLAEGKEAEASPAASPPAGSALLPPPDVAVRPAPAATAVGGEIRRFAVEGSAFGSSATTMATRSGSRDSGLPSVAAVALPAAPAARASLATLGAEIRTRASAGGTTDGGFAVRELAATERSVSAGDSGAGTGGSTSAGGLTGSPGGAEVVREPSRAGEAPRRLSKGCRDGSADGPAPNSSGALPGGPSAEGSVEFFCVGWTGSPASCPAVLAGGPSVAILASGAPGAGVAFPRAGVGTFSAGVWPAGGDPAARAVCGEA